MKKIKDLLIRYKQVILYLIFGVMTTAVDWGISFVLYQTDMNTHVVNVIAWTAAVLFAFVTNKPLVFGSHDWSAKVVLPDLGKFVGCRIGSGLAETVIIFITVDLLNWNGNLWKIFPSILVVILNYIGSKLLVFKKK